MQPHVNPSWRLHGRVTMGLIMVAGGVALLGIQGWRSVHVINLITHASARAVNLDTQLWLGVGFILAVAGLFLLPRRGMPVFITVIACILGLIALTGDPNTSTDSARYAWDGIVQKAGISPYAYVPADAHLTMLRPSWLFPPGHLSPDGGGFSCPTPSSPVYEVDGNHLICTIINRPLVPTIYPPAAEILFFVTRLFVPASVTYLPMQVVGFICMLGMTLLLLRLLKRETRHVAWAAIWAWSPLVTAQAITNAHVDTVAALLAVAGTGYIMQARYRPGGILLGLGVATKFLPLLLLPTLLRHRPGMILLTVTGTVTGLYLLYAVGGVDLLGYLPGYFQEEGYGNGSRAALLNLILPPAYTTLGAGLLLLLLTIWCYMQATRHNLWYMQLLMVGGALLLLTPRYPWYALLLLPLIALSARPEWLGLVAVFIFRQYQANLLTFQMWLINALLLILVVGIMRAFDTKTRDEIRDFRPRLELK